MKNVVLLADGQGGGLSMILMLVAIFAVMYFTMIRPQVKRQKAQKKFIQELDAGTKVVTIGGIHGKIAELKETTVVLELGGGQKIKVEKAAIQAQFTAPGERR